MSYRSNERGMWWTEKRGLVSVQFVHNSSRDFISWGEYNKLRALTKYKKSVITGRQKGLYSYLRPARE